MIWNGTPLRISPHTVLYARIPWELDEGCIERNDKEISVVIQISNDMEWDATKDIA
jgi:hypothetical protein